VGRMTKARIEVLRDLSNYGPLSAFAMSANPRTMRALRRDGLVEPARAGLVVTKDTPFSITTIGRRALAEKGE
jgi:predicted transcriptional regulator